MRKVLDLWKHAKAIPHQILAKGGCEAIEIHLLEEDLIPAPVRSLLAALLSGIHILHVQLCVAQRLPAWRGRILCSCTYNPLCRNLAAIHDVVAIDTNNQDAGQM